MSDKIITAKEIMQKIPHRYPFILVDRVLDYEEGKWIKAIKNLTLNEPFFMGHFPSEPIMPGVLQIEALAQTGGILAMLGEEMQEKLAFFMAIKNAKFRKPAFPGDQLVFDVEISKIVKQKIVNCNGKASVDGKVVCEAEMMFIIASSEEVGF